MEIYLVRHGLSVANAQDIIQGQTEYPLDERGRRQAELLAPRLAAIHFDRIFSSDLGRAQETARLARPGAEITPVPQLREWQLGNWVGRTSQEVSAADPGLWRELRNTANLDFRPPGGESRRELRERAASTLEEFAKAYPEERILAITHAGFIAAAFAALFDTDCPVSCGNTGISVFRRENGLWSLIRWNDTAHLESATGNGELQL